MASPSFSGPATKLPKGSTMQLPPGVTIVSDSLLKPAAYSAGKSRRSLHYGDLRFSLENLLGLAQSIHRSFPCECRHRASRFALRDLRLFPRLRPAQRPRPSLCDPVPCCRLHGGGEALVGLPLPRDVFLTLPEPDGQSREIRGAERGRLGDLWSDDRDVQHVGLQLHQQIVRTRSAVDAKLSQLDASVGFHRLQDVHHLEHDPLERGTGDVCFCRTAGKSDDRPARILIPVRRAKSCKRRNEIDTTR